MDLFVSDDIQGDRFKLWEGAEVMALTSLQELAFALGANAVVGLDISMNPFTKAEPDGEIGLALQVVGTAARLEDL